MARRATRLAMDGVQMTIVLLAAIGEQRQLGLNNELLWKLPGDLPRFKEMTMGSPIIMGRKTFDSIGRPLPGRTNIVISRNTDLMIQGATVVTSITEAIEVAEKESLANSEQDSPENIFVIGGGEIYTLFLPEADALELTLVEDSPEADAFFPDFMGEAANGSVNKIFKEVSRETNQAKDLRYHYVRYERASASKEHSSRD